MSVDAEAGILFPHQYVEYPAQVTPWVAAGVTAPSTLWHPCPTRIYKRVSLEQPPYFHSGKAKF
jgi:hypothetical protein